MTISNIISDLESGKFGVQETLERLRRRKLQGALSEGQKGLWVLQKTNPNSAAYNIPIALRLRGPVDPLLMQRAYRTAIHAHPGLRHALRMVDGVPIQYVREVEAFELDVQNIWQRDEASLLKHLESLTAIPFLIQEAPLSRAHLLLGPADACTLLLIFHHIICDARSAHLFVATLLHSYEILARGQTPDIARPAANYGDFVKWEADFLASDAAQNQLRYWLEKLAGEPPRLDLPVNSSPIGAGGTHVCRVALSAEESSAIRGYCRARGINNSAFLLSSFKLLLHRYSGESDIIVGVPAYGRPLQRFEDLTGYFVNMIAIRDEVRSGENFMQLAQKVHDNLLEAMDNASYPFRRLMSALPDFRGKEDIDLFQAVFDYKAADIGMGAWGSEAAFAQAAIIEDVSQQGEYPFILSVADDGERFHLTWRCDGDRCTKPVLERCAIHLSNVVQHCLADPHRSIGSVEFLADSEKKRLLFEWNDTGKKFPPEQSVHAMVERCAMQAPAAVAVEQGGDVLIYRELNERANALARTLIASGVRPGAIVGVSMPRSPSMIVALLAVLKTGAAYVPIDPANPHKHLMNILRDTQMGVLLTDSTQCGMLERSGLPPVLMVLDVEQPAPGIPPNPNLEMHTDSPAYVVFTSGSTGQPKGVRISHRSLINLISWHLGTYQMGSGDRMTQLSRLGFDAAAWEIWPTLACGATLVLGAADTGASIEQLVSFIRGNRVTIAFLVTPVVNYLMANKPEELLELGVRVLLTGGDKLGKPPQISWPFLFVNHYGPTENTVVATAKVVDGDSTIGRPIANVRAYVLDGRRNLAPVGSAGELYLAGEGLALGYIGETADRAQRFCTSPHIPEERLYRTGDLVRYHEDGNLEFLGRLDNQVKIRGFRIEPSEIEEALNEHPAVEQCAVISMHTDASPRLAAYVVAGKADPDIAEIRGFLRERLPPHMIPTVFKLVDRLPRSTSDKIDRKALCDENLQLWQDEPLSPARTADLANKVAGIMQEVLELKALDIDAGFFELGGDSFLAIAVCERIRESIWQQFSVTDLLNLGSIRNITAHLERMTGTAPAQPANRVSEEMAFANVRSPDYGDGIAIVGMSCHFPGASDYNAFWKNLRAGVESIEMLTPEQIRDAGVPQSLARDPGYVPVRATIAGKHIFDADFFQVAPGDADLMDLQLRHLLCLSWEAIEDAGYAVSRLSDTAVFISASGCSGCRRMGDGVGVLRDVADYVSWGAAQPGTIPTTISHKLRLKGPSLFVHTNCSSSLVALDMACRHLKSGQSRQALVGAAAIFPETGAGYVHQKGLNFSSDGHIRAFDAAADGMVGGEGAAVLLLKRLEDAVQDGDHIHAIVCGSAVNNDGGAKVGFYAPSVAGQVDVIGKALSAAKINPEDVGLVEAHGTGTRLGDPVEVRALTEAYHKHTARKAYCGLGTVKTNLGHLDTAAGLAGCIKLALSLSHREIPPTLNYAKPNAALDLENSPFYVVDKLRPWPANARFAALSSFGIGGTNAHAILKGAPAVKRAASAAAGTDLRFSAFPLSARNHERLVAYAKRLSFFLTGVIAAGDAVPRLEDVAFTLQTGREAMAERVVFLANTLNELREALDDFVTANGRDEQLERRSWFRRTTSGVSPTDATTKGLVQAWLHGRDTSWDILHHGPRYRIPLPTYPFAETEISRVQARPAPHAAPQSETSAPEENQPESGEAYAQTLLFRLKEEAASFLKFESRHLENDRNFIELGLDSMHLTRFAKHLAERFGWDISPAEFYDHPTFAKFAEHLQNRDGPGSRIATVLSPARLASTAKEREAASTDGNGISPARESDLEPIAIIGMSGRFPDAADINAFWRILLAGEEVLRDFPAPPSDGSHGGYRYGRLPDAHMFDHGFFGLSLEEARGSDVRQRLLLEEIWNALEDAALGQEHLAAAHTGLFLGLEPRVDDAGDKTPDSIIASWPAYFMNLRGPVMAVNASCASGLAAVHLACQSLRSGESNICVVASVNADINAATYASMVRTGTLSGTGRMRAFDVKADGMVPAEAAVALVLKPLARAIADGDPIHAVIRHCGINYHGKTNGITAPGGKSQIELFRQVYSKAGIAPDLVRYVVAHGTATQLGDAIEIDALCDAFSSYTSEKAFCALTSNKPNFGHSFAASGLINLVNLIMAVKHAVIPPSLNYEATNTFAKLPRGPFFINRETLAWPDGPRIGATTALGANGTNAHVVVESHAVASLEGAAVPSSLLFVFSAKNPAALGRKVSAFCEYFKGRTTDVHEALAASVTLLLGRRHFRCRWTAVIDTTGDWLSDLERCAIAHPPGEPVAGDKQEGIDFETLTATLLFAKADRPKYRELLCKMAEVYQSGTDPRWHDIFGGGGSIRRLHLPTYPFERTVIEKNK